MMTGMPPFFVRAIATISRMGRICPVMLMTWLARIIRVRAVMFCSKSATILAGSSQGMGSENCLRTIPSRRSRCLKVVTMRA